jgi:biopolymer transport protein ExbB
MKRTALALALILAASAALFAEEPKPTAKEGDAPVIHSKTLWVQIKEGGWVMFPIAAVSILTFYLIGDGFIRITSPKKMLPTHQVATVKNFFRHGQYVEAYHYCKAQDSAFANVARVAISSLGEGKSATEEAIMTEMTKESSRIQTFVSYLSVIGVCAPMIGLLGTVTGMIGAFAVLGSAGIGDPSSLSAAIGEVLVATASGLFIAIPAFGSYYWLRNRGTKVLHDIHDTLAHMLRKMPYDKLAGAHIGDEEIVAADPDWCVTTTPEETYS